MCWCHPWHQCISPHHPDMNRHWVIPNPTFSWQHCFSSPDSCVYIISGYFWVFGSRHSCSASTLNTSDTCEKHVSPYLVFQQQQEQCWRLEKDLRWVSSGLFAAALLLFGVYYQAVIFSVTVLEIKSNPTCVLVGSRKPHTHVQCVCPRWSFSLISRPCFSGMAAQQRDCWDRRLPSKSRKRGPRFPGRAGVKLVPTSER